MEGKRSYTVYFIACFFAVAIGVALIINGSNTGSDNLARGEESVPDAEVEPEVEIPIPTQPEIPIPEDPREPIFRDENSQLIEENIDVNGRSRRFKIFIPGAYFDSGDEVPLVFVFHGSLGSPENMIRSSNMNDVAERENFIVVFPASRGPNFEVFDLEENNDLDFALAMIDFMKSQFRINSDAIYSHGYSNGGFLSHMLACKHTEIFAGIAPMAGTFDHKVFPECSPSARMPVLQIHGTRDSFVPYDGNRQIISVEETLEFWANQNGDSTTPVITEFSSRDDVYRFPPGNIVQHYRLNGIGHLNVIESFDAQLVIDFFKSVSNFQSKKVESRFDDEDSQLIEEFIPVNGRNRRFKVFIPGIYFRTGEDVPVVFVFHGSLGSPENMLGSSNMNEVAEKENFIAVYPAANGANFEVFDLDQNNDLDFALNMIEHLSSQYRIRSDAIYSHGFSNGGFLSHMLACKYSGIFAGIAPMAGTFDPRVFPNCAPSEPVPVLQIHGTRDSFVPYDGNRQIISVADTLEFWATSNGDETTPIITEFSSRDDLFTFPPSNTVQHFKLNGIGHLNVIDSFDAQLIIDFFKSVSDFEKRTVLPRFQDSDSQIIEEFIEVNGRNRRFKIFVPGVYDRTNTDVPLVFVFHGSLGSPENMLGSSNINEVAEIENFITVFPASNGANFEVFDLDENNDIDFALLMIDFMKQNFRIKEGSIYSHGFSNGGFLSHMLACKHSNVFAGIAPMAGTFDPKVFPNCAPSSTIPVLQIHGTNDFFVPYGGNRQIISVEETLAFWAAANGQDTTPVVTEFANRIDLFSYPPNNIVQHFKLERVGHLDVIEAFDAQLIIEFFKGVSDF